MDKIDLKKESTEQEYSMLKQEIQLAVQRQDQYFLLVFSMLGIGSIVDNYISNINFLIFILMSTVFIQLKIIECRTIVIYTAAYMLTFLETPSGIMFENRFNAIRINFWKGEHLNLVEENKLVHAFRKFGYFIKNSIIFWMALFIYIGIVENALGLDVLPKIIYIVLGTLLIIVNFIYAIMLISDRKLTKLYIKNWKILKDAEQKERNLYNNH